MEQRITKKPAAAFVDILDNGALSACTGTRAKCVCVSCLSVILVRTPSRFFFFRSPVMGNKLYVGNLPYSFPQSRSGTDQRSAFGSVQSAKS